MEITKTVRVPIHHALTKRKLHILNRLTARFSYCVWLFSGLIEQRNMSVDGYGEFRKQDIARIGKVTKLNAAHVQQCRDQALWMWRSYHAQHKEWEWRLRHAKGKWHEKLLKREPQKPFHNGLMGKVPVRIDVRTGTVEASKRIKLSPYVLRRSTLRKNSCITIPLNLAKYHRDLLRKGRTVDFQLVKRSGWYLVHICVKCAVAGRSVRAVRGVDLGVRRAMATVLLRPKMRLRRCDLSILKDGEKKHRLDQLNRRVAGLQQARKCGPLRRLSHRRRRLAEYFDRLDAIRLAKMAEQEASMVAVGYPFSIKYRNHRGNGRRFMRRTLQQRFSYGRRIRYVQEECAERGVVAEPVLEAWTSASCHRCSSTNTRRLSQSVVWCLNCGLQYNADWNAAINIGSVFLPAALSRRVREGLAHAGDELAYKPASLEAENVVDAAPSMR